MAILDAIEHDIVNSLKKFIDDCEEWDKNSYWTSGVKDKLIELGHELGYLVATSKKKGKADWGEWLYDLIWYENHDSGTMRLKNMPLACEIEWDYSFGEIQHDFEKLLVARTQHRLMILQADNHAEIIKTFNALDIIVDGFELKQSGDRYLYIGYDCTKYVFTSYVKVVK